jgi:hypothetical protein
MPAAMDFVISVIMLVKVKTIGSDSGSSDLVQILSLSDSEFSLAS